MAIINGATIEHCDVQVSGDAQVTTDQPPASLALSDVAAVGTDADATLSVGAGVGVSFGGAQNSVQLSAILDEPIHLLEDSETTFGEHSVFASDCLMQPSSTLNLYDLVCTMAFLEMGGRASHADAFAKYKRITMLRDASLEVDWPERDAGAGGRPASVIEVSESLSFEIVDESSWAWGGDATLSLAGGVGAAVGDWGPWTRLEVGGADLGDVLEGFDGNFDLSRLRIGAGAHAYLEDLVDNGNRAGAGIAGAAQECLYVDTLEFVDADGVLNLNGLTLYAGEVLGSPGQVISVTVGQPTVGDLDGNAVVDGADLAILLGAWGTDDRTADLDGDGAVDGADLAVLLGAWGVGA